MDSPSCGRSSGTASRSNAWPGRHAGRWLCALVLLAAALRLMPWLAGYPLHRDEALYGYWARLISSGQDPLLLAPWIDKPPLAVYLMAGAVAAFGPTEAALRLPGMLAGLLLAPLIYGCARRAFGAGPGLLAAGLYALSPFAILFAPTAFTDPWLVLWLIAACWAALAGRPYAAGLAVGLAIASKQQGVLAAPLVIALLAARGAGRGPRALLTALGLAVLGCATVIGPLITWDSLRWHNRPSFWDHSLTTYGGLGFAAPADWPARIAAWAEPAGWLFGTPALSAALLVLALGAGLWWPSRGRRAEPEPSAGDATPRITAAILACYMLAYLALHVITTVQPWDRYLLPLLPLICMLAGLGLARLGRWCAALIAARRGVWRAATAAAGIAAAVVLAAGLAGAAYAGAAGRLPAGSDHGAYAGLDRVIAVLRGQPANAVIYHRWLGWHYDFYLFGTPYERRWWDSGWKLAEDAGRTADAEPERPQWVVLPAWEADANDDLRLALSSGGLALVETGRFARPDGSLAFTLYRVANAQR